MPSISSAIPSKIAPKPTVLVLDDEEFIRDLVADALESEGYRVIQAADGREGLALVESECPNAIVLDLMMPRMNGMEFLNRLQHHHCPVIVLSASLNDSLRKQCSEAGVCAILDKPFSLARLRSLVKDAVQESLRRPPILIDAGHLDS
ncbi:MAG: response regulator transcription factor [Chloroflexi bacterium]|nr:response regulator transcription factor [Chloroflexota bacterium]